MTDLVLWQKKREIYRKVIHKFDLKVFIPFFFCVHYNSVQVPEYMRNNHIKPTQANKYRTIYENINLSLQK